MLLPSLFFTAYLLKDVTPPTFYQAREEAPATGTLTIDIEGGGLIRSVPPGSTRVPLLTMNLTASCTSDIRILGMTLRHRGMGDSRDILGVYAMNEGARVTRRREIQPRSNAVEIPFRNFVVPACQSVKLFVLADFSPNAAISGEHQLVLEDAEDTHLEGGEVVLRSPPPERVYRRQHYLYPARYAVIGEQVGTLSVTMLPLGRSVHYGVAQLVARVELRSDEVRDQLVFAMTLTNGGSAKDSDLRYLYLETTRGELLTEVTPMMDGRKVRLVFDPPLKIPRRTSKVLELRADVYARTKKTIEFGVEESGDIESIPVTSRR